jgi:hypothetical protein
MVNYNNNKMSFAGSMKESFLGAASTHRGSINTVTMVTAFVLSIMVINNYRQCKKGKGYPKKAPFVKMSYTLSIIILIACCLLFAYDLGLMANLIK